MTGIESVPRTGPAESVAGSAMIWIGGEARRASDAYVSALDRGLTLADGLFETMRLQHGSIFRLGAHLDRLRDGARRLRLPLPDVRTMLDAAVRDATRAGRLDGSVRLTVTRGSGAPGLAPPLEPSPTVIITLNPLPAIDSPLENGGITVRLASGRRNEHAPTVGLKTLSYTDSVLALLEARDAGVDDAIFLDTAGHLAEATTSNLFIVSHGALLTAPLSCGVLPGITRAAVLECARALGLAAAEHELLPGALEGAEEAFLTSSVRGLRPIAIFQDAPIGVGAPGPVTRRLAAAYDDLLRQECSP